ncbi:MAG: hypothetical protein JXA57_16335 [Armatimonadetes bacterium]|nr:hypothetical protein [Armatimonadota bacterium]
MDCPNKKTNAASCTCTYPGCSHKGRCCECVRYHRDMGEIPGCLFSAAAERTYDRSAARFLRDRS